MILGKHKVELAALKLENQQLKIDLEKVKGEVKTFKESLPQIYEFVRVVQDVNTIGAGIMEFRRLDPDSVFKLRPS